jgi:hypothetical protein
VQGVRIVAGLGVAHLPYHLTAERVQHVIKKLPVNKKIAVRLDSFNWGSIRRDGLPGRLGALWEGGLQAFLR